MKRTAHNIGERRIREAMAIPGRFKADGCFRQVVAADGKVLRTYQLNRKFRRSGGRAS